MNKIDSALALSSHGFYILPVMPNSKIPALKDWPSKATRDIEKIKEFWKLNPSFNIGISTTDFKEDSKLVVIDIDIKGDRNGEDSIKELINQGFDFPKTYEQRSPSGGRHLFYKSKKGYKNSSNEFASGIDIRASGGFVVGAGSTINGSYYEILNNAPIADLPSWLELELDKNHKKTGIKKEKVKLKDVNQEYAKKRALVILKNTPNVTQGARTEPTYRLICRIKDTGLLLYNCLDVVLRSDWNENNTPPWNYDELFTIVNDAYKYGVNAIGIDSPENTFEVVDSAIEDEYKSFLEQLNEKFAIVYIGRKHLIVHEYIGVDGLKTSSFIDEVTFKRRVSPLKVSNGGKGFKYQSELWLDWEGRREYQGVCFKPCQDAPLGMYNLWHGWPLEPCYISRASSEQKRGVKLFQEHILNNVCESDETLYNWFMGYLAHMFQRPYERPLTAIGIRGKQGTGKNFIFERIGKILGQKHFVIFDNPTAIDNKFNSLFENKLLVGFNEALWTGKKRSESVLKGLITSPQLVIEKKGVDSYVIDSLARFIIMGNEDWIVPVSLDDRRFAVFEMSNEKRCNSNYFKEMIYLLDEQKGAELLFDYFLNFDLSTVDINTPPLTNARTNQKLLSLGSLESWLLESLQMGKFLKVDCHHWTLEPLTVTTNSLLADYYHFLDCQRNYEKRMTAVWFGRRLNEILLGEVVTKSRTYKNNHLTPREYLIPPLPKSRNLFEQYLNCPINWAV